MVMPNGINVGTEHQPRCPDTVEKQSDRDYCEAALVGTMASERATWKALDAATDALEPWWFRALRGICVVLWFLRPLRDRLLPRFWLFDGSLDHRMYDCCTWSGTLGVPDEERRMKAALVARELLRVLGYTVEPTAFNVAPGSFPITRSA